MLYKEAITISRRTLSSDHPDLVVYLNNLGELYTNQGRFEEAEPLDQEAIGSGACAECGMHRRVPPGSNFQAGRRRNRYRSPHFVLRTSELCH